MELPLHQIDAFTHRLFSGNPAAVMPLPHWLPDTVLRALADENHCAETAFYVDALPPDAGTPPAGLPAYHLRWFTPLVEVDLCGHATLAAAAQVLADVHVNAPAVAFFSRSGWLTARRAGPGEIAIDLPASLPEPGESDPAARKALGLADESILSRLVARDQIYVLSSPAAVAAVEPDLPALSRLAVRGVIVTAAGGPESTDFVSRFFGGQVGGGEDPVTGSAHAQLAPYWAAVFGRETLRARQLSARGGDLTCTVHAERVDIVGAYRRYSRGIVTLGEDIA
jgi:PhzF family phenazine biosynthesis protein